MLELYIEFRHNFHKVDPYHNKDVWIVQCVSCVCSFDTFFGRYVTFRNSVGEEEDIFASRQFTTLIAFYGCLDVLPVHAL